MEIPPAATPTPDAAVEYRLSHRNRLMIFTTLKAAAPTRAEFCRMRSVETLAPGLWITVDCLDGSTKRFRPEMIRLATEDEARLSDGLL